ncbi:unnamed protein product [Ectocarpus sp. CCAP 1310/34]|nr:unnamed protein product [Ectocarpus sp. CCAP 1310/34]
MNSLGLACMRISRLSARRCRNQRCRWTSASKPSAPASAEAAHTPVNVDDTHFGFQQVPSEQKKGMVKGVFTSVAHNYDVMNDLMSAGMHRIWKDEFVDMLRISPGFEAGSPAPKVLDVAGGTGDIAFRVADQLRPYMAGSPAGDATGEGEEQGGVQQDGAAGNAIDSNVPLLTVSDINPDMLEVGEQRAADRFSPEILTNMQFVQADAEALPFEDNSFHLYTIAFGLRNVTDVREEGGRTKALVFSCWSGCLSS